MKRPSASVQECWFGLDGGGFDYGALGQEEARLRLWWPSGCLLRRCFCREHYGVGVTHRNSLARRMGAEWSILCRFPSASRWARCSTGSERRRVQGGNPEQHRGSLWCCDLERPVVDAGVAVLLRRTGRRRAAGVPPSVEGVGQRLGNFVGKHEGEIGKVACRRVVT